MSPVGAMWDHGCVSKISTLVLLLPRLHRLLCHVAYVQLGSFLAHVASLGQRYILATALFLCMSRHSSLPLFCVYVASLLHDHQTHSSRHPGATLTVGSLTPRIARPRITPITLRWVNVKSARSPTLSRMYNAKEGRQASALLCHRRHHQLHLPVDVHPLWG